MNYLFSRHFMKMHLQKRITKNSQPCRWDSSCIQNLVLIATIYYVLFKPAHLLWLIVVLSGGCRIFYEFWCALIKVYESLKSWDFSDLRTPWLIKSRTLWRSCLAKFFSCSIASSWNENYKLVIRFVPLGYYVVIAITFWASVLNTLLTNHINCFGVT